jgi:hypothetical protein
MSENSHRNSRKLSNRRHFRLIQGASLSVIPCCLFLTLLNVATQPAEAAPSTWSITSSPNKGAQANYLNGVSCANSTSCMAVGDRNNAKGVARTLIESWNGSAWSIVPSPDHGSHANVLNGVSCTSSIYCVAVGYYEKASGTQQTLIETWNGTTWGLISSPDATGGDNYLNGVSCADSSICR